MNIRITRPSGCRWVNSVTVLELLRDHGPLSRADIARYLGLTPASVSRIIDELLAKQLVVECHHTSEHERSVGRPPVWIMFNAQASYVVSVDLGGTLARAALLDLDGNIVLRSSVRSKPGMQGQQVLMKLIEGIISSAESSGVKPGIIVVGVPGVVVPEKGIVVSAPSLDWHDFPLRHLLEEHFQLPVIIENDVNLHALGEHWRGAGRGASSLVCVFIGTGIGAGIILNGELYRGATYSAGEIGYSLPDTEYLGQTFAEFGCLEHLASGFGIAQRGKAAILEGNGEGILKFAGSMDALEAVHVLSAYQNGDDTARRIVESAQRCLALALINIACVLNPEMIVLGGGIVESGVLNLPQFRDWLAKAVPFAPKLVLSALGSDAGLLGAVALALRSPVFLASLLGRRETGMEQGQHPVVHHGWASTKGGENGISVEVKQTDI